jgi:anti-sigma regulatory factor (Ser/Thr protein kinase)
MAGSTLDSGTAHRVTLDLPLAVDAPAAARRALDGIEHGLGPEFEYTVKLLISELVTNAVQHCGDGHVQIDIEALDGTIRVDVVDCGPSFIPGPRVKELDAEGGWGLVLVDQLSSRWGSFSHSAHVWFEIDAGAFAQTA